MAWYAWTATNAAGKTQRGTLQAEGPKQVRQALRDQQLIPVSITVTREQAASGGAQKGVKLSTPCCRCLPASLQPWLTPRCRWKAP
ncbi:Cholera toxin secretion protein epsF [Leclercia adecarboxylata]|uniref:Cholera toxin secretion protein epsF n=1 Tax=Leclercia adecarboxylata TaxID=83655 RepID=A0A4U9HTP2_9ENTR|nr:Cholera toxin secretion protein epsF [Leclercia adecarboxylata]